MGSQFHCPLAVTTLWNTLSTKGWDIQSNSFTQKGAVERIGDITISSEL